MRQQPRRYFAGESPCLPEFFLKRLYMHKAERTGLHGFGLFGGGPSRLTAKDRVTPPPSAFSMTKLSAGRQGSSYRVTVPFTMPEKCSFTFSAVTFSHNKG